MNDLVILEQNKPVVLEALGSGEFDYMEPASEVVKTGFSQFITQGAFDKESIFIGDASCLFVPDNPSYEGSVRLLFDEHNHPVSLPQYEEMTDEQKIYCKWRRCYKMVTLLHTNSALDFFLFVAVSMCKQY